MSTSPINQWPEDWHERMEAKLDAYRDKHVEDHHAIDKRVSANERDIALFKTGGAIVGAGVFAALSDVIKRKFGIGQ